MLFLAGCAPPGEEARPGQPPGRASGRGAVAAPGPSYAYSAAPPYCTCAAALRCLTRLTCARPAGPLLAFHKLKDPVTLSLLPIGGGGACVCAGKPAPFGHQKGKLHYNPTNQTGEKGPVGDVAFGNSCSPAPRTVMLEQANPTCDLRTYVGGQIACHHMWSLLDADQDIPWPDQPLEYHLKVRFWVQPYNASYHVNVAHKATWGIASPVEYDVPKCGPGIPGCSPVPGSSNINGADGKEWIHTIEARDACTRSDPPFAA